MKGKEKSKILYLLASIAALAAIIFVWWLITDVLKRVSPTVLPSPFKVFSTFIDKFTNPNPDGGTMVEHMLSSLQVTMTGYGMGILFGIPLGICMAWFKSIDMFVRPLFDALRPIPGIAWIPVMIVLFGIGLLSKAIVIFLASFIPCVVNSYSGIKQTKSVHLWVGQTFGATSLQMLFRIAIPTSLPMIITGMRVALGTAWSAIVAAEMLASTKGLGFMIQQCRGIYRTDVIIAGMIAIGIIGAVLIGLLSLLERAVVKGGKFNE